LSQDWFLFVENATESAPPALQSIGRVQPRKREAKISNVRLPHQWGKGFEPQAWPEGVTKSELQHVASNMNQL
jgi:hypothetical protein